MKNPKGNCIALSDLDWNRKESIGEEGKFGCVYRTNWTTSDADGNVQTYIVAVKCPKGVQKETVLAERDIKSSLSHKNIVIIFGFAQLNHNRDVALVFEYSKEATVYDYIWNKREGGGATAEKMMGISLDIARGMQYLHKNYYCYDCFFVHPLRMF